jgi:hypothetical protein
LELPDSDLLKAIHAYASDFYSISPEGDVAFGSMNGTALVAMGILLEEMCAEDMGETGHLALLESAKEQEQQLPTIVDGNRVALIQSGGHDTRTKLKPSAQRKVRKTKSSASPLVIPKNERANSEMSLSDD